MEKEYIITKEECEKNYCHRVCTRCGNKLEAIETVDNSDRPTYWPGCMKDTCCRINCGCLPQDFAIARNMIEKQRYIHVSKYDIEQNPFALEDATDKAYRALCAVRNSEKDLLNNPT